MATLIASLLSRAFAPSLINHRVVPVARATPPAALAGWGSWQGYSPLRAGAALALVREASGSLEWRAVRSDSLSRTNVGRNTSGLLTHQHRGRRGWYEMCGCCARAERSVMPGQTCTRGKCELGQLASQRAIYRRTLCGRSASTAACGGRRRSCTSPGRACILCRSRARHHHPAMAEPVAVAPRRPHFPPTL